MAAMAIFGQIPQSHQPLSLYEVCVCVCVINITTYEQKKASVDSPSGKTTVPASSLHPYKINKIKLVINGGLKYKIKVESSIGSFCIADFYF